MIILIRSSRVVWDEIQFTSGGLSCSLSRLLQRGNHHQWTTRDSKQSFIPRLFGFHSTFAQSTLKVAAPSSSSSSSFESARISLSCGATKLRHAAKRTKSNQIKSNCVTHIQTRIETCKQVRKRGSKKAFATSNNNYNATTMLFSEPSIQRRTTLLMVAWMRELRPSEWEWMATIEERERTSFACKQVAGVPRAFKLKPGRTAAVFRCTIQETPLVLSCLVFSCLELVIY